MIVSSPPSDRQKRIAIIAQLVRLCGKCGSNTYIRPADNARVCVSCGCLENYEVWEMHIQAFRRGLAELNGVTV